FSVQYHPEGCPGPQDNQHLYDRFIDMVRTGAPMVKAVAGMQEEPRPRKVLILGSGPIVIGQAAEFDYAGTQACKALREEGIETDLVNSNPATIMTDEGVADRVYLEPLTVDAVERVIARERPDALLPTLGGQTGLNLATELAAAGVLDRYHVRMLGARIDTIRKAEDREAFKQMLIEIGEPVPISRVCESVEEAEHFASEVGLPLVIRPAYTLGGTGGGFVTTHSELHAIAERGLAASPIRQVLIERSLWGWKEIEYEVTGRTLAAFEPALDYCVVKIPRWPFDKFPAGDRRLGTQMASTGEVMAIERTFEAAVVKALRSLEQKPPAADDLRRRDL